MRDVRKFIYVFNFILSAVLVTLGFIKKDLPLTVIFADLAFFYLFLTLLASPLIAVEKTLPFKGVYLFARRALGVSSFYFAVLHSYFAFFKNISKLDSLKELLSPPLFLGFLALVILYVLTLSSFDSAVRKLGKNWKRLHRLVYLAGILILFHSTNMNLKSAEGKSIKSIIFLTAVYFLLALQSLRLIKYFKRQ